MGRIPHAAPSQVRGFGKGGDAGKGGGELDDAEAEVATAPAGWPAYTAVAISKTASSLQSELLHERIVNLCIEWHGSYGQLSCPGDVV